MLYLVLCIKLIVFIYLQCLYETSCARYFCGIHGRDAIWVILFECNVSQYVPGVLLVLCVTKDCTVVTRSIVSTTNFNCQLHCDVHLETNSPRHIASVIISALFLL